MANEQAPVVVQAFISLDGVTQGPGGPGEDNEGGFPYGGWSMDYDNAHDTNNEGGELIMEWESKVGALLLGRKTYDIWVNAWAVWDENEPGPMGELTRTYNRVPKYIATHTLTDLTWKNSEVLGDDLPAAIAEIRAKTDGEVRVWGSADFIQSLAENDLVDEYRLIQYPIVLGTGKKLFADGFPHSTFEVAESRLLGSGNVVTIYRRRQE